jgi:hypothetical protein
MALREGPLPHQIKFTFHSLEASPEKHFLAKLSFVFLTLSTLPFYPFRKDISAPQKNAQEKVFLAFVESEGEDKRPRAHHIASAKARRKQKGTSERDEIKMFLHKHRSERFDLYRGENAVLALVF